MENKNIYILLGQVALEYRVSLANLCKLLGQEPNDKNKIAIYEMIMSTVHSEQLELAYDFLFNYQTIKENQYDSSKALTLAAMFIKKYNNAIKNGNEEELRLIMKELSKTEDNFNNLLEKQSFSKMTEEEALIVLKYKLKFCLSKMQMKSILGTGRELITRNEEKITDEKLKRDLRLISEFYEDLYMKRKRERKK